MKLIIAGSRSITDYNILFKAMSHYCIRVDQIERILSGGAPGVDSLAEIFAKDNAIPFDLYKADWKNLDAPNAIIRTNRYGEEYNKRAGLDRNELMAQNGDVLLAIWDGESTGTKHMIQCMQKLEDFGKKWFIYRID